jgi:lipid II:glycine glycyltransferase (peptidoglycan interpeptide bridge formation enzyme)
MSNIEIKKIESEQQWNLFVDEFAPHTFLQSWQWKLSQEVMGNDVYALGIFKANEIIGAAFVYKINARRGSFLFCPHGPLIKEDWQENFKILFEYLKLLAKKEKVDFIRISPLEIKTQEKCEFFKKIGFKDAPIHMHPELGWLLDITLSEEELLANMKKRTRYSINKAKKDGVEIFCMDNAEHVEEFYPVYLETAKRQIFVPFSKEYVKKEFEIFSKENKILVFFAKYKGEIITTAMIIYTNGSGFYHHGASIRKYSNITSAELLQWHAILEAKKRGLKLYNFWGISPEDNKNHPWTGVTQFKKGFGGFAEEYVHAQDYPVTLKYWLNYAIETIRRIKRKY